MEHTARVALRVAARSSGCGRRRGRREANRFGRSPQPMRTPRNQSARPPAASPSDVGARLGGYRAGVRPCTGELPASGDICCRGAVEPQGPRDAALATPTGRSGLDGITPPAKPSRHRRSFPRNRTTSSSATSSGHPSTGVCSPSRSARLSGGQGINMASSSATNVRPRCVPAAARSPVAGRPPLRGDDRPIFSGCAKPNRSSSVAVWWHRLSSACPVAAKGARRGPVPPGSVPS